VRLPRGLFGWAVRQGLLEKDPTAGMPKEHETARTRVLSDEEIRTLITGFDQTRYGRALRLLFLTALRRDEVLGLELARPGEGRAYDSAERREDGPRPR
jgi:integrase